MFIDTLYFNPHRTLPEGVFPFNLKAVQSLPIEFHRPVTFFVGENGSGKSTVMEALAAKLGMNLEGGSRNYHFTTTHEDSLLAEYTLVGRSDYPRRDFFFRAETLFNLFSYEASLHDGLNSFSIDNQGHNYRMGRHLMSHGEGFFDVLNHLGGESLYLLDEPESALSPEKLMSVLIIIHELVGKGSQFVICTHSPILAAYPGAEILQFSSRGIRAVEYEETELFRTYKSFLDSPRAYLHHLLGS